MKLPSIGQLNLRKRYSSIAMSCSNTMSSCYCQCESALFRRRGGVPLPYHRLTWISDALVRQSLDCLLGIAPRDAGLGVLSGRVVFDVYPGLKPLG